MGGEGGEAYPGTGPLITPDRLGKVIALLNEMALFATGPCTGFSELDEDRGEMVLVCCQEHGGLTGHTVQGEHVRHELPVDGDGRCKHRRAHILLAEMGIRRPL